ncbi:uncharacterized protein LOC112349525 [Selaginella moellendorffii]|nr:uncharacterized protein LOC112349525 [Selaginella moellendorffii]|eukprot:XP_024539886.1 uncharacterized protein LOC112349525 [Selaginella moellendorffii]
MCAKRSRDYVTVEEAREAVKTILDMNEDDIFIKGKSTLLPYPGIGDPVSRPPVALNYVGRGNTLFELLGVWISGREVLILGPKGIGKSSDFRAMACVLYKWLNTPDDEENREKRMHLQLREGVKYRPVFLWAETFLIDHVEATKNALLFSYLVDEIRQVDGWQETEAAIASIVSMEEALGFIKERKKNKAEVFYFFIDGGEALDPSDFLGTPVYDHDAKSAAKKDLRVLLSAGTRICWCTSPKAGILSRKNQLPSFTYKRQKAVFDEQEYSTFAGNCLLGKLPARRSSIELYTGFVPLFLDVMATCCETVLGDLVVPETNTFPGVPAWLYFGRTLASKATDEVIAMLNDEDEYWDCVLRAFTQHSEIDEVRKKASKIQVQGACRTDANMARLDPTYVLDASTGEYCSSFIKRIYLNAVREKEEAVKPYADGAWMAYASRLLQDKGRINWSTVGQLCEDVLAAVVARKGLRLGSDIHAACGTITVQEFDKIPSRSIESIKKMAVNTGYYFKPRDLSFPDVDAVIVWVDETGAVNIIALQYTVNVDEHRKSANQFMSLSSLRLWFPDIEKHLGNINLHFAFVGCSSQPGYSRSVQLASIKQLKNGTVWGTPEYVLHVQPFDDKAIPGLAAEDYGVLVEITSSRTWNTSYSEVQGDGVGLLALTRKELDKMAKQDYGLNPKDYKNKALLINAMLAAGGSPASS